MSYIIILNTKKYIEAHFDENIKLDDIAKEVGYSKYHLNRIFRKSTSQSIHKYLRERRLYEAAYQLLNTDKSIVEIALSMGYSSQPSFTFAFKQEFGCTPQIYRSKTTQFDKHDRKVLNRCNNASSVDMLMFVREVLAA